MSDKKFTRAAFVRATVVAALASGALIATPSVASAFGGGSGAILPVSGEGEYFTSAAPFAGSLAKVQARADGVVTYTVDGASFTGRVVVSSMPTPTEVVLTGEVTSASGVDDVTAGDSLTVTIADNSNGQSSSPLDQVMVQAGTFADQRLTGLDSGNFTIH